MKQAFTSPPKDMKGSAKGPGKKKTFGHAMGGMFGAVTPKKPEFDTPAPTRAAARSTKDARMKRLSKQLI